MKNPSSQQQAYFDWIVSGTSSVTLKARAGSGKTSTLIAGLKFMKGTKFLGAFNKKIAEEMLKKAGNQLGLEVSTMHAAGMRAWKKVARFPKVESNKVRDIFRLEVSGINPQDLIFEGPVVQLVSLAKQSGIGIHTEVGYFSAWDKLIDQHGIETFDEYQNIDNRDHIIDIAQHIFNVSAQACQKIIDFDDMIFAPLFFNVSFDKYDWVLIDEAQDTNAVRREMALRMLKPTGRLVAVGDDFQAIYAFTGADTDALDLITAAKNSTVLPLSVSFRCPKAVIKYAQQWCPDIQHTDTAAEGVVRETSIEKLHEEVKVGDAILCRFNAPLIKNVYQLIARGIPARIEGREIGAGLKQLANRWKVKTIQALQDRLDTYLEREIKKFEAKENQRAIEAVTDKVNCLRVIIERVIAKGTITQPPQLAVIAEIDAIFGIDGDNKPVVLLSSIHKAKGLEFNKVVWLQTGPSPYAKTAEQQKQEFNLFYVATTRAMNELVLIDISKEKK